MTFFAKKPAPNPPSRAQLADDFRRRIAEAVSDAQQGGLGIHDITRELTLRVELLRNAWACSAPLGQRVP
jgi:hypothetical protein